jgi:hypothetical protein
MLAALSSIKNVTVEWRLRMNIEQTKRILKNMPNSKSVMLHAKHGVGKSSVVKQVSEELSAELGKPVGFWDVRLSQCEVGDIKGLPDLDREAKVTRFLKRLDGEVLPDGWRVVAAVNSDDDYDVVELDPALHDRWFHIDFDPDVKEWCGWARENDVHPAVVEFINRNNNLLDPPIGNLEAGRVYPSRRSWVSLSDSIVHMNLESDEGMLTQVTKGWVGREIAVMFQKFVTNEFSQLTPADVLDTFDDSHDRIEAACDDIEVIAALARSVVAEVNMRNARKMKDSQKDNLKKFFMMLPNDVASQAWVGLLGGKKSKSLVMNWQTDDTVGERLKEIYLQ